MRNLRPSLFSFKPSDTLLQGLKVKGICQALHGDTHPHQVSPATRLGQSLPFAYVPGADVPVGEVIFKFLGCQAHSGNSSFTFLVASYGPSFLTPR